MLKGLYIERHNEAVAILGKSVMEGAKGGCLAVLMTDAGWHGKVTGLSLESRIPAEVLPDVPDAMLRRMRPDILLFEKGAHDLAPLAAHQLRHAEHRQRCRVHVVEVGFCTEVAYPQKYKEKNEQHAPLLDHLKRAGYADVQLHLLILGSTGGMFRLTALHLAQLGIANQKVDDVLQDMHWKALKRLEQIVGTRRRLEHEGGKGSQDRRKACKRKRGT